LTKEFYTIIQTIVNSPYYTSNPNEACLFVPSIDLLNQNLINENLVGKSLATLQYWENGENHILFNVLSGAPATFYNTVLDVNTDRAIIVGTGFDSWTYRSGFDLSMPFYSPILESYHRSATTNERKFFLISSQLNIFSKHLRILRDLAFNHDNVLLLQRCQEEESKLGSHDQVDETKNKKSPLNEDRCGFPSSKAYSYPVVLETGTFCLIIRGVRLSQPNLLEAMATNCIPVIVADNFVMPFSEIIDWNLAAITIRESDFHSIMSILKAVSETKVMEMQKQVKFLYEKYFRSLEQIVLTVLDELNDRVFPHLSKNYLQWNVQQSEVSLSSE
jgi:glucuronyl/N-acetylglucosaminyl transferase EXT2